MMSGAYYETRKKDLARGWVGEACGGGGGGGAGAGRGGVRGRGKVRETLEVARVKSGGSCGFFRGLEDGTGINTAVV